jgi:hypothetical protein
MDAFHVENTTHLSGKHELNSVTGSSSHRIWCEGETIILSNNDLVVGSKDSCGLDQSKDCGFGEMHLEG